MAPSAVSGSRATELPPGFVLDTEPPVVAPPAGDGGYVGPTPEQVAYLAKVRAGRAVLRLNPELPVFSQARETIRQAQAVDRANAAPTEPQPSEREDTQPASTPDHSTLPPGFRLDREVPDKPRATPNEFRLGTPLGSLALGAADLVTGPLQYGVNRGAKISGSLGDEVSDTNEVAQFVNEKLAALNAMSERGRAAQGREGTDYWRQLGSLGTGVATSLGGKTLAYGVPYATKYAGQLAQGIGLGGLFGLTSQDTSTTPRTPEAYLENQNVKGKAGAVAGGVMSGLLAPLAKGAYNLIRPHLKGGEQAKGGEFLVEAAGDRRAAIEAELAKKHPPYTTAGQAATPAKSAEFSAVQDILADRKPSAFNDLTNAAQAMRVQAVEKHIAKTPERLAADIAKRTAKHDPLYAAVKAQGDVVDTSPVVAKIDAVLKDNPGNEQLVREFSKIRRRLFSPDGVLRTDAQHVSSLLDGLKTTLAKEDNKFITRNLLEVKEGLTKAIPGYQAAQESFAKASGPINQMQYGQELLKELKPVLGETERSVRFANARANAPRTIQRALENDFFEKESDFLTSKQIRVLDKVEAQLQRDALFKDLAKKGMPAANELVGEQLAPGKLPNPLMRAASLGHYAYNRLQGGLEKKTLNYLADVTQDPNATAALMRRVTPGQQAVIKALMERGATVGAAIGVPKLVGDQP